MRLFQQLRRKVPQEISGVGSEFTVYEHRSDGKMGEQVPKLELLQKHCNALLDEGWKHFDAEAT